jgi:hypothetical protein
VLSEAIEDLAGLWSRLTADQLFRIGPLSPWEVAK